VKCNYRWCDSVDSDECISLCSHICLYQRWETRVEYVRVASPTDTIVGHTGTVPSIYENSNQIFTSSVMTIQTTSYCRIKKFNFTVGVEFRYNFGKKSSHALASPYNKNGIGPYVTPSTRMWHDKYICMWKLVHKFQLMSIRNDTTLLFRNSSTRKNHFLFPLTRKYEIPKDRNKPTRDDPFRKKRKRSIWWCKNNNVN
jgi:hypothetical protein